MQQKNYKTANLSDVPQVAKQFLADWKEQKYFAFFGEMGVGKTTFIKALCEVLRVEDVVTSPTFAIVNEYTTETQETIYHFDFYRIKSEEEVLDIGFDEYIDSRNICLMEWAEKIENLLPENLCRITICEQENGMRNITAELI